VPTYERPEACARAVRSALGQEPAPQEVLVCDDGSGPETREQLRGLVRESSAVRVLELPHRGTPGPARTAGCRAASAPWVAFLDDDDAWLPGKLARQLARAEAGDVDAIGTNARRSDGSLYFRDAPAEWSPTRDDLLRDNPLIVSTVLARRDVLLGTRGFREARWARGVADYSMWLALADTGARIVVLGEPLVDYESDDSGRMSAAPIGQELAVARLFWMRWLERPRDLTRLRAAANRTIGTLLTTWALRRR
jgi:glycosyltransferase involved in cell wall biosynthesis